MSPIRSISSALSEIGLAVQLLAATKALKQLGTALVIVLASLTLTTVSACDQMATSLPQAGSDPAVRDGSIAVITGRVVSITDGDTLTLLDERNQQHVIRLAEIDAPERAQPWGNRSKEALSKLTFGRAVSVRQTDTDRYGRIVGRVFAGGADVNQMMVEQGAAWAYRQYLTDDTLIATEARARRQRAGLWSMGEGQTVAPWAWRKGVRLRGDGVPNREAGPVVQSLLAPVAPPGGGGAGDAQFRCSGKRLCRQMTSCAEANFYLSECGVASLDGNGDGQPCEVLCGTASR